MKPFTTEGRKDDFMVCDECLSLLSALFEERNTILPPMIMIISSAIITSDHQPIHLSRVKFSHDFSKERELYLNKH
jgi:hypothetical protein